MFLRFNIFLALHVALVLATGCSHDSCLRAVIAGRGKLFPTLASQDCISFFHKTVTPCPSTTTVTVTARASEKARRDVELLKDAHHLKARAMTTRSAQSGRSTRCPVTAAPTAVPKYASACSGTVRYSSACSFIGVTEQTVTTSAPIVTKTITVSATVFPVSSLSSSASSTSLSSGVSSTSSSSSASSTLHSSSAYSISLSSGVSSTSSSSSASSSSSSSSASSTSSTATPGDCENSPTSRQCWGKQSIDTNFYEEWPQTGKTREYWLSVQQGDCAPDGYKRTCMTFNGTIPGPLITADWGDNLVIHVTNNMQENGTAIHWHGLRQLNNTEYDGVPGITQCPIPPGETQTYRFPATQYGSTWYHSHFTLQYAEGLLGPLVINGPTSANYDEDLGMLFLSDWSHVETFTLWDTAKLGAPPVLDNTLINGTNTFDCSGSTDGKCVGGGKKFETVFEKGKKYKIRLINTAIDGVFQFSIDGHNLTVVSADLVPMKPFAADSIVLHPAQRYDVIVEASAEPGDYWLRGGWLDACAKNKNPNEMTGIVRYDAKSTSTPSTTSTVVPVTNCFDIPAEKLVPALEYDVGSIGSLSATNLSFTFDGYFKWLINTSSLLLDWADPTVKIIMDGKSVFPTDYNVIPVEAKAPGDWFVLVIQDTTPFGLSHPIHLHGHDSWILEQKVGKFDGTTSGFNFKNPARRDTVTLPGGGYIAIAFEIDNPGAWICHCHIAWHASEGLSLELVESEAAIPSSAGVKDWKTIGEPMCNRWAEFYKGSEFRQEDSGI